MATTSFASRLGTGLFKFLGVAFALFAVVVFVGTVAIAWQLGADGTGIVGGLTVALVSVGLAVGAWAMARGFALGG